MPDVEIPPCTGCASPLCPDCRRRRIGSLFSGYGGLDMGVRSVLGGEVAWHCEIEPAAARLLEHHHPRHTWRPVTKTKTCVICEITFTPHKTKRARAQTCGSRECKSALLSRRWEARRAA